MESLFLLAFGEEEFLAALAMTGLEAFFNKLLGKEPNQQPVRDGRLELFPHILLLFTTEQR